MTHDNSSRRRYQYIVYWEANGFDTQGEVTVKAPVELLVRIEKVLSETLDSEGNKIASSMQMNVPQTIVNGSLIWIGRLKNVADPPNELLQVIGYDEIPNIRARKFDRWIDVMKHSNKDPVLT